MQNSASPNPALPALNHRHAATSPSTNSELMEAVQSGKLDASRPHLLTAETQTAGRGQHGRTWQSPEGNVYLSLYYPLDVPLSGILSLMVGYQLTQMPLMKQINRQRQVLGLETVGVKWANDIGFYADYHGKSDGKSHGKDTHIAHLNRNRSDTTPNALMFNKFNKLAGILIEPVPNPLMSNHRMSSIKGVIVGVGLNVRTAPALNALTSEGMDYHAISLNQLCGAIGQPTLVSVSDLYLPMGNAIMQAINRFIMVTHQPFGLYQFLQDYASVSVLAGRNVVVEQPSSPLPKNKTSIPDNGSNKDKLIIQGEVIGINADGSLQIKCNAADHIIDIYTGKVRVIANFE